MSLLVKQKSLSAAEKYKRKDYIGADLDYTYCIDNADSNDNDLANYYSNRCATRLQLGKIQEVLDNTRRRLNGGAGSRSSSFPSSFNNNIWIKKAKDFISLGIAKFNQILLTMDENTKKINGMGIIGLFLYYFLFRKRQRYDYDDYDSYGGSYSRGMSWSTWIMIMGLAYYLPPMFPQQLGTNYACYYYYYYYYITRSSINIIIIIII